MRISDWSSDVCSSDLIFGAINDRVARDATARILAMVEESAKPIDIYVNSPGGHVESGDTIHDVVRFVRSTVPVRMIGTGWVASAGALIFLGAEAKNRFCLPNTRFLQIGRASWRERVWKYG